MSFRMDRRIFLGNLGLTAGAVVATSLVPLSVVHALPTGVPLSVSAGAWAGHVDDAWGHWPPYSHPIPYGREKIAAAQLDGLDHLFLA
jgi:hypothetical protein